MPAAYSVDLRKKILHAYARGEQSVQEIADLFSIGMKTVYRYIHQHEETGDLTPGKGSGRKPIMNEKDHQIIIALVKRRPDIMLKELCDEIERSTGKRVSVSVMCDVCKKLNLSRKKQSFRATERDETHIKKA